MKNVFEFLGAVIKELWVFILGLILVIVLVVFVVNHEDKSGRNILEQIAHEVGELVGEASKGFDEVKKK